MTEVWAAILVCIVALSATLYLVRRGGGSLGMPVAYMIGLLLIHVPGAFAFVISNGAYSGSLTGGVDYVSRGIGLAAIGAAAFPFGVWLGRGRPSYELVRIGNFSSLGRQDFLRFCLIGGWCLAFGFTSLRNLASIGAAINFGSSLWMLGVMLGLDQAVSRRNTRAVLLWFGALSVYPLFVLLFGGFLSYGASAVILVLSLLFVRTRSYVWALAAIAATVFLGMSVFVTYYASRDEIRNVVWSGSSYAERIDVTTSVFSKIQLLNPSNPAHLKALDERLNQNEFVGLSAERIQSGDADFLRGKSIREGIIALVPRLVWPDKPVFGGSPKIVRDMTGLTLSENTSFGVGNVMEFYINFGVWSLVGGFLCLGGLIGWLDKKSYDALQSGRPGDAIIFFLPCVALIQPNGSIVELASAAAASLVAAIGWRTLWNRYSERQAPNRATRIRSRMNHGG